MTTANVAAEWSPHRAMWLGYPSHGDLWEDNLIPAQAEVAALARALAGPGGERVRIMACGDAAMASARAQLDGVRGVEFVQTQFGDIWLRDTGPIFLTGEPAAQAARFRFNGWGGKYVLEDDDLVAEQIAAATGVPLTDHDFVLEGGALDHDGFGAALTTRQCLLNSNRNPGWTEAAAEAALSEALGVRRLLWLDEGMVNDHTDGHVDNLARFVAPGVVACPVAYGAADPNAAIYDDIARALAAMSGPRGAPLQVARIASPGRIEGQDGAVVPASHMNFIIANTAVIAPIYDEAAGELALDALRSLFPERAVIGLSARAVLTGGGSFHCITQQEPA